MEKQLVHLVLVEFGLDQVGELNVGLVLDPVSDRGVLAEGGAQGGDLLGQPVQVGNAVRVLGRGVEHVEGVERVHGEDLPLGGQKGDVDLLQRLDVLGAARLGEHVEQVAAAGLCEEDVGAPVLWIRAEVVDEARDRVAVRLDQVDGLQLRDRLAVLHDVLDDGHALAHDVVHLAARGNDAHAQVVHDQDLPVALLFDGVASQDIVHYFCEANRMRSVCSKQLNEYTIYGFVHFGQRPWWYRGHF
jgi:hypothetical protein